MERRDVYLILILILGGITGQISPAAVWVFSIAPAWYPSAFPFSLAVAFYLSSLLTATLAIMIAGLPAAAYERIANSGETNEASLRIWFGGTAFLCALSLL